MATLANHGVAQTLNINLMGKSALVTAYAVANLRTSQREPLSATEQSEYLLDYESRPTFASSPPLIPFGLSFLSQPPFLAEVAPEFLHSITNPFAFTDEWRHPSCIVERRSQSEEGNDGRQFMEEQESRDMRQGRIDQGRCIALQGLGKTRSNAHDSGSSLF